MSKIRGFFSDWSLGEICWLIFVCLVQVVVWFVHKDTVFMLVLALTGSLNLVLGAKGKIAGLYFAIINSAMYAYTCLDIKLYGEIMYNVLYSIPVSAIAIFLWKKNVASSGEVKFRTMNKVLVISTIVVTAVLTFAYSEVLSMLGGNLAFMDSLTTVVSVVASLLFLLRFSEQWLMWVVVNALSITMWMMVLLSGDSSAVMIIVMKLTNLLNSLYGYLNWKKIANRVA